MMNNAIYPGSFDPITNGHLDIIRRASKLYDNLFIAVSNDSSIKSKLFTVQDRIDLVYSATKDIDNVKIIDFDCLIVDLCKKYQSNVIIRGLRALSDYDFEFKMALMNRSLNDQIVTLFMMPHERYTHISSSLIKEVASHGGDISKYVPSFVNKALGEAFEK
ncbi:MAG: pantetheine-phosphate adenylyltransferase [bacterium TMED264]|nr:pantetheine-phosphate adenylyltransferase [Candidatus Neomarinimicrobiota bacterium]OUX34235.1 MAG: pantetheine-phosphate adenylyltransferase [bacterium TMED264]